MRRRRPGGLRGGAPSRRAGSPQHRAHRRPQHVPACDAAAGIDPANPPLATYDQFLATSKQLVSSGAAPYAIYPSPASDFFQSWFDFYPLFAAATGGTQLVKDGKSQFAGPEGVAVANFWKQMYADKLAGNEAAGRPRRRSRPSR